MKDENGKKTIDVKNWLIYYLAKALEIPENEIDTSKRLQDYGFDSTLAIILIQDLGNWLNQDLEPTLLLDYPTIEELHKYLNEKFI